MVDEEKKEQVSDDKTEEPRAEEKKAEEPRAEEKKTEEPKAEEKAETADVQKEVSSEEEKTVQPEQVKRKKKQAGGIYNGTGRRKKSVARVRLVPGEGKFFINGERDLKQYFQREPLIKYVREHLKETDRLNNFDVYANVRGGGITGQAGALTLGISRALVKVDESLRPVLKKGGYLTRDARMKERKKYGQRGARARFQFSKR